MAKQYHPDLHPDDKQCAEKFQECNEAYEILGDPERRRKYDSGEMDFENFNFGGRAEVFDSGFEDIFDIFSSFMGGGSRSSAGAQRQTPRGSGVTCSVRRELFGGGSAQAKSSSTGLSAVGSTALRAQGQFERKGVRRMSRHRARAVRARQLSADR
ncbi:MAG: DnaJ domain-containing protein [Christensenellales bacterium]